MELKDNYIAASTDDYSTEDREDFEVCVRNLNECFENLNIGQKLMTAQSKGCPNNIGLFLCSSDDEIGRAEELQQNIHLLVGIRPERQIKLEIEKTGLRHHLMRTVKGYAIAFNPDEIRSSYPDDNHKLQDGLEGYVQTLALSLLSSEDGKKLKDGLNSPAQPQNQLDQPSQL